MPYRVDVPRGGDAAFDRLVELGALDVEAAGEGGLAALMPDAVTPSRVAAVLGVGDVAVSPAVARDEASVWVLRPRPIRVGAGALTLLDTPVFGTGLHPTTALCLEALQDLAGGQASDRVLDVGTGSGVLALAALRLGARHAIAVDIDPEAVRVALANARANHLAEQLTLVRGGPDAVRGTWPLVLANVLAAPLIDLAPMLVRRVGHYGRLVLSGIPISVEQDVLGAYRRQGMRHVETTSRAGWVAVILQASW